MRRLFTSYQEPDYDPEELLREFREQIEALAESILAGEQDYDLRLADLVENEADRVRVAIVEKLREMVRERSQDRAKELEEVISAQKLLEQKSRKQMFRQMLAYFMSEETLRKIRESLMVNPAMQKQVEDIGQELARKGVLSQQVEAQQKQNLGELSANVQQTQASRTMKENQGKGV